ncbi:sulfotransferase [Alcanivorax sp. DP30]|uniref:sulfotransferase family protein n=1 Tax=Alcanivorax sp. DP30 TaxID=2606217 RepID=UPI00137146C2|nr:sulfotransferase [Alcanivorax sp. DP30]MZR64163.1 hypothetical protein [Alcanivorax sp. DP30]
MDFFIVGYPKAGTTSLYEYMKSNPMLFFPEVKEPHYFTRDYPGCRVVDTFDQYMSLYQAASEQQLKGDASASVIHSDFALDEIINKFPDAKFIVILRDPVAAFVSFHGELLHNLNEAEQDIERAWSLQEDRANGECIPSTCLEPGFLQYKSVFNYRSQLPAFFDKVPESQRLVLIFEEFFADPRSGYLQALDFLDIEDDGRLDFGAKNTARKHRFRTLAEIHKKLVNGNSVFYRWAKAVLSFLGVHPSSLIARFNQLPGGKPELSTKFKDELEQYFQADIDAVEKLLGRPVDSWRK